MDMYFTFGTAHAGQWIDRVGGELTHPDGWVRVTGPSDVAITAWALRNWPSDEVTVRCAFWYATCPGRNPDGSTRRYEHGGAPMYPRGELGHVTVDVNGNMV